MTPLINISVLSLGRRYQDENLLVINQGIDVVPSKKLQESIIYLYEISFPEILESTGLNKENWSSIFPSWLKLI